MDTRQLDKLTSDPAMYLLYSRTKGEDEAAHRARALAHFERVTGKPPERCDGWGGLLYLGPVRETVEP